MGDDPNSWTGYSAYGREILSRLTVTGRYELALLVCDGPHQSDAWLDLPYRVFSNAPDPTDRRAVAAYNQSVLSLHGSFRFKETCLAFRPDVVATYRDYYADEFLDRAPYRRHYRLALMGTIDSEPQPPEVAALYSRTDATLTYTRWGAGVLGIPVAGQAPPAADYEVYSPPPDKAGLKRSLGLPGDSLVVGFVGRNIFRKLQPDLIKAFARLVAESPPRLAGRLLLYLHCRPRDSAWDLPRLLRDAGVLDRTYFTYSCSCGAWYPDRYTGLPAACRACGNRTAAPCSTRQGLPPADMANVFGLLDAHVQYSNLEGFGVPTVEAAACGVPGFAVDYSAMGEVIRAVGGTPVPVLSLYPEPHSHRLFARPDDGALVAGLAGLFRQPAAVRAGIGFAQREAAKAAYSYDRSAAVWASVFDTLPAAVPWDAPVRRLPVPVAPPAHLSDWEHARHCVRQGTGREDYANGYPAVRMAHDLSTGTTKGWLAGLIGTPADSGMGGETPYDRGAALEDARRSAEVYTQWEAARARAFKLSFE